MEDSNRLENWIDCCHTIKVLKNAGIKDMKKLSMFSYEDLLNLRGVGPVIASDLQEVKEKWLKR